MKNKLYNLINGGLLSLSAILVGMTMMVAGCSNPDDSVMGGNLEGSVESSSSEWLEGQSSSDEQIGYPGLCLDDPEASGCEVAKPDKVSSSSSVTTPRLVTTSSSMEQESSSSETASISSSSWQALSSTPRNDVSSSSSTVESSGSRHSGLDPESSSDGQIGYSGLCLEDPEASGCEVAKPDKVFSSSSVTTPRLVTTSSSMEQVESSSSVMEQSSDSNGDKKISRPAGSDPNCEASYTREWSVLCDTLHNYILFEKTLETLDEDKYVNVYRWEDKYSVEQFSMPNVEFRAKYRSDEPWLENLVDEGIVWDGGEWDEKDERSGLNVHYIARPDTVLHANRNELSYLRVVYRVFYYIETEPNVEHRFDFDIPVRYRCYEFEVCKGNF